MLKDQAPTMMYEACFRLQHTIIIKIKINIIKIKIIIIKINITVNIIKIKINIIKIKIIIIKMTIANYKSPLDLHDNFYNIEILCSTLSSCAC